VTSQSQAETSKFKKDDEKQAGSRSKREKKKIRFRTSFRGMIKLRMSEQKKVKCGEGRLELRASHGIQEKIQFKRLKGVGGLSEIKTHHFDPTK